MHPCRVRLRSVVTGDGHQEGTCGREALPFIRQRDQERKDQPHKSTTGVRSGGTACLLDLQAPEVRNNSVILQTPKAELCE